MGKYIAEVGMDVHGRSVTPRACDAETGEVRGTKLGDCPSAEQIAGWIKAGRGPWHAAYESGPTGFQMARELRALGVDCDVAAVTTLPRSPRGRARKNDKADADAIMQELLKPTRSFSCVWVPDEEVEGARNLVRLRCDAVESLGRERRQVSSFLLTRGHVWNERTASGNLRRTWTADYRKWLGAISFGEPAAEATFQQLKTAVSDAEARLRKAEELMQPEPSRRWHALQQKGGLRSCGQGLGEKSGHRELQVEGPFLHLRQAARHPVPQSPSTVHSAALEQRFSWQT